MPSHTFPWVCDGMAPMTQVYKFSEDEPQRPPVVALKKEGVLSNVAGFTWIPSFPPKHSQNLVFMATEWRLKAFIELMAMMAWLGWSITRA